VAGVVMGGKGDGGEDVAQAVAMRKRAGYPSECAVPSGLRRNWRRGV